MTADELAQIAHDAYEAAAHPGDPIPWASTSELHRAATRAAVAEVAEELAVLRRAAVITKPGEYPYPGFQADGVLCDELMAAQRWRTS
jgi:hypothetical protein